MNIDVYIAKIPFDTEEIILYPPARQEEVLGCTNEKVRRHKYYVWKLLLYALEKSLSLKGEDIVFEKTKEGKWICPACFFSLSHSENIVAVALSENTVGVDVEKIRPVNSSVLKKLVNEKASVEEFFKKWTEKESVFKAFGRKYGGNYFLQTQTLPLEEEKYVLSVVTEEEGQVNLIQVK